jgi:uncharacterized damage-inducible protein DinB
MNYSRFLNYVHWANSRVLEMLRANPRVESSALALFAHLLATEHLWLCRLRKVAPDMAIWPELGLDECERLLEMNFAGYRDLLKSLSPAFVASAIAYETTKGVEHQTPVSDILIHVFGHGHYHRGQLANSVKRCGGEVLDTDYITFVREVHD